MKNYRTDTYSNGYKKDRRRSWLLSALALTGLIFLHGCATAPPPSATKIGLPDVHLSIEEHLILKVGDFLEIQFVYSPELNRQQAVRQDGKICVGEAGYVQAAGRTAEELARKLEKDYSAILQKPVINVILRARDPQFLYVGGQVHTPGLLTIMPMSSQTNTNFQNASNRIIHGERVSLAQAIIAMGGFIEEKARMENVVVIRNIDGQRYVASFDMRDALKGDAENAPEPVFLAANDVVFVPRTKIEILNQWVDQHINRIIPLRLWASYANDNMSTGFYETNSYED